MSKAHEGSSLPIKTCLPVDEHTVGLWHFDITEEENLHGIKPIESIATLRPFEGNYGGGIAVEEGTTNILPSNIATGSSVIPSNHTSFTLNSLSSELSYVGPTSTKGVQIQEGLQRGFFTNGYSVSANTEYIGSCYVFTYTPITYSFWLQYNTPSGWISAGTKTMTTIPNTWTRLTTYSATSPSDVTSSGVRMILNGSFVPVGTVVYFDALQLERKPFATSFVNGSRINGRLTYSNPGLNRDKLTVSCWVKPSLLNHKHQCIFALSENSSTRFNLFIGMSHSGGGVAYWDSDNHWRRANYHIPNNEWSMVSYVLDGTNIKFYHNGRLVSTQTANYPNRVLSTLHVGGYLNEITDAIVDEFRIDKIARTDEEIAQWYHSQAPFFPKGKQRIYL